MIKTEWRKFDLRYQHLGCKCVRYTAGIVDWTIEEVASMDRKNRKILTMNGCLHIRSNVARLYLPRKEEGRGLIGIDECVKRERKLPSWLSE